MANGQFPYVIEPMRWEDVPSVMAIERDSFPLPWSSYTYRHELTENTHSHYIVARTRLPVADPRPWWRKLLNPSAAPIVGYGGFWLIVDEAHISTIAVAPDWRGRGLGEFLLAAMIERAINMSAMMVTLEVRVTNTVAQNLYTKYHFVITGTRPRYYRDNNEDAHIMTVEGVNTPEYQAQFAELQSALIKRLREGAAPRSGQTAPAGS